MCEIVYELKDIDEIIFTLSENNLEVALTKSKLSPILTCTIKSGRLAHFVQQ